MLHWRAAHTGCDSAMRRDFLVFKSREICSSETFIKSFITFQLLDSSTNLFAFENWKNHVQCVSALSVSNAPGKLKNSLTAVRIEPAIFVLLVQYCKRSSRFECVIYRNWIELLRCLNNILVLNSGVWFLLHVTSAKLIKPAWVQYHHKRKIQLLYFVIVNTTL